VARTESERAIDLAYKAVARRELTVAELRTRLERKRVPPEAIDDAVEELEATGFLDDERYARQFTEDKRELDQWGSERIARDLHRRGIARHLIEEVVSTRSRDSELQTAILLLEQRHPSAPADATARGRCWCAAATRRRSRTTRSGRSSGRRGSAAARHSAIQRLPARACRSSLLRMRPARPARDQKTSKSPDFVLYLNVILTNTSDRPERSAREGP
jgi:SOS response regulatory protein OraA/RecX